MLYSDLLTITREGIRVPESSLRPLGIFDGSSCWGVWYQRLGETGRANRHLIISAIHPRSWPFLLRIRMYLRHERGALEKACRFLDAHDLSIVLGECTKAGFDWGQLNVIAESLLKAPKDEVRGNDAFDLKDEKRSKEWFDFLHPTTRSAGEAFKLATDHATNISELMLVHLRQIDNALRGEHDVPIFRWEESAVEGAGAGEGGTGGPIVAPVNRVALVRQLLKHHPGDFTGEDDVRRLIQEQVMPPFTVRYMHRLMRFAIFGGGADVPIAFQYDAGSSLLRLERPEAFQSEDAPWPSLPCPAVVMFNPRDKFLRVDPASQDDGRTRLTRVAVDYSVTSNRNGSPAEDSRGLLWRVCQEFAGPQPASSPAQPDESNAAGQPLPTGPYQLNVRDMSVKWTLHSSTRRSGCITFIGDARPEDYAGIGDRIVALNHCRRSGAPRARIGQVRVHEYPRARLFLSLHFGHPREEGLLRLVRDLAYENGMDTETVHSHTHPATGLTVDTIRSSQAFLQLLSFRANEDPERVNFTWLDFEYGVALGLGIPTLRLVDVVRKPYDWWRLHIATNPDQHVKEFRSDVTDEVLSETLREALGELATKLGPQPGC